MPKIITDEANIAEGAKKLVKKLRKCLGHDQHGLPCGKLFMSEWEGNRICPTCKYHFNVKESSGLFNSGLMEQENTQC